MQPSSAFHPCATILLTPTHAPCVGVGDVVIPLLYTPTTRNVRTHTRLHDTTPARYAVPVSPACGWPTGPAAYAVLEGLAVTAYYRFITRSDVVRPVAIPTATVMPTDTPKIAQMMKTTGLEKSGRSEKWRGESIGSCISL